jgi:uncharacterized membrane protein
MTVQQAQSASESSSIRSRFPINAKTISYLLVFIGLGISLYLSYVKLTEVPMACPATGGFSCGTVQGSVYAELWGIPIAWLGLAVNITILGLLILEDRIPFLQENGLLLLFGLVLFAGLYSAYLIYVQGVILDAWCMWCLLHEAYIFALLIVTGWRLRNNLFA